MTIRNYFVLFFLLFDVIHSYHAEAQNETDFKVRYIGIEMGLSNNAVTSIYQDKRGFMWVGTYDGLNRYDGYDFLVYRNQPNDSSTLINNRIVNIFENGQGIWIGTKKGLSVYNYQTGGFENRYLWDNHTERKEKITYTVNQVKGDDERIYVATGGKGLISKTAEDVYFRQIPFLKEGQLIWNYHAQGLDYDRKGNLWVFIQGHGLFTLNEDSEQLEFFSRVTNNANTIVTDGQSRVWLGMDSGLLMYLPSEDTYSYFSNPITKNKVTDLLYLEEDNAVWIATDGGGVAIYSIWSDTFSELKEGSEATNITSNSVYALYKDTEGKKWIGTLRGGINVVERENLQFKTVSRSMDKNSLVSNFILSFCEYGKDRVWIGTDGGGVSLWDRSMNTFTNYVHIPGDPHSLGNNFVTSILETTDGAWFGTYGGGISRFEERTGRFKSYYLYHPKNGIYQNNIWVLFRDSKQNVWAGTSDGEGLYRYRPDRDEFEFVDAGISGITAMMEDQSGNLWVGTFEQLVKLDLKTFRHEIHEIGYPVREIVSVSEDHMLLGTESGGLLDFNPNTGVSSSYSEEHGLPNNSVLNILQDHEGQYWLSTYHGISRFDYATKTFTNYLDSDGLQSNQFNYNAALKLSGGELLFGGIMGFNIINPAVVKPMGGFPKLLITDVRINNVPLGRSGQTVFSLDALELPYQKSMLTFGFAALEYSLPDKISYAYYLEGWDREWQYVGKSRVANYSKLEEGKYILHIKSTNSEGKWNPETTSLEIKILPPWYRTPFAYFIYVGLLALVMIIVIRYQKKQARLRYEIWLSKDMAQKEKELNEKKLNFFTNISHEFRSPLTMIINPLKDAIYGKQQGLGNGEIEVVYRNSRRLLSLVDQLLLFRRTESEIGEVKVVRVDLVSVCKEVYACFVHHAKSKNIEYKLKIDEEECYIYGDRQKIEISLFNLISNALKFTAEDSGKVLVTLKSDYSHQVEITVEDNGVGIAPHEKDKIFELFYQSSSHRHSHKNGFGIGLYLVRQFIRIHSGEVLCTTGSFGGTCFQIRLLKGKSHLQNMLIHEDLSEHSVFLEELIGDQEAVGNPDKKSDVEELTAALLDEMRTVMVIDDNPQIRRYIKSILSTSYRILEASNAPEAWEVLKSQLPDLILSDVVMGDVNGVDFCKSLKTHPGFQHIPVILLTASNSEEVKLKGIEVGADDYITKPFDRQYLKARIDGILKRQKTMQDHLLNTVTQKTVGLKLSKEDKVFLEQLEQIIELHLKDESFTIKCLAVEMGMSHSFLYKKIKTVTGKSINELIRFIRLRKVATMLITSDMQVNEAAFCAGFNDLKHFRRQFQLLFEMNPSEFQKKYRDTFQDKDYNLNSILGK